MGGHNGFDADRIGVSTNLLDTCSHLASSLERLAERFTTIEIEFDHELRAYLDRSDDELAAELEQIAELRRAKGLRLSVHAPYTGRTTDIASLDETERLAAVALLERSIALAAKLGAARITIHPGYRNRDRKVDRSGELFAQLVRSIETLSDRAHAHGVRLCMENTGTDRPNYIVLGYDQHLELCERFDTSLTMDLIHYTSFTGMDEAFYTRLQPLLAHTANVHFADMMVPDHVHIPLGTGTLRYHEIIHYMSDAGYLGNYIVEERGKSFTETDYLLAAADYRRSLVDAA
jgi:sugar phosphate isomerase/epimerase